MSRTRGSLHPGNILLALLRRLLYLMVRTRVAPDDVASLHAEVAGLVHQGAVRGRVGERGTAATAPDHLPARATGRRKRSTSMAGAPGEAFEADERNRRCRVVQRPPIGALPDSEAVQSVEL